MPVWLHQGALPWIGQEHYATYHTVRTEQFVDGAHAIDRVTGISAPAVSASAHPMTVKRPYQGNNALHFAEFALAASSVKLTTLNSREN